MIRVCHVITQLELGGAQQNTLHTVRALDRTRFEPVLVSGPGGELDAEAGRCGAPWHVVEELGRDIAPARDLAALVRLTRLLRRLAPAIVHTHSSKAGILGRWAATLAGVPHIVHSIHGYGFHQDQSPLRRHALVSIERVTGRLATSAFVAVSKANMRTGIDLGLFEPGRVSLIRSGVRLADFAPRRGRRADEERLTVGMIACLKPQKAPLDFIEVASRVVRSAQGSSLPPVRFVLVGDGALRGEVERAIARAGIGAAVELAGWRRDVPEILREFDVLLHTSRWEGLPRVFPEAMATGLPIVATRVDGAPEAIDEGATGYLLDPGDVEGMARRVIELLGDAPLRLRMGERALTRTAPWDIDAMVRRQERLYEELSAGGVERAVAVSTQERVPG